MMQTLQSNSFENVLFEYKKILALQVQSELAIVFFTGSECEHCIEMRKVIDIVMPRYIGKLQFFTINLSHNKEVVGKAEGTVYADGSDAKIEHVPIVVFYRKHVPVMRFKGNYNEHEFVQFITNATAIATGAAQPVAGPNGTFTTVPEPQYAPPQALVAPAAYSQNQLYAPPPVKHQQVPAAYAGQQQQQHYPQTYQQPPQYQQSPYQQSYYNTPHYRPPMPEPRLARQNFEMPSAERGFQSVENCSGKKFCYQTLGTAYKN